MKRLANMLFTPLIALVVSLSAVYFWLGLLAFLVFYCVLAALDWSAWLRALIGLPIAFWLGALSGPADTERRIERYARHFIASLRRVPPGLYVHGVERDAEGAPSVRLILAKKLK